MYKDAAVSLVDSPRTASHAIARMLTYEQQVEFTPIFMTSNRERVIASTHPHDRACEHTALLERNPGHERHQSPHRLVVRTSRCGRDNPGSAPGGDMCSRGEAG